MEPIRLNKFLAERLGVSRREADNLITKGVVFVNDKIAVIGQRIEENDKICYNDKIIDFKPNYLYLALNKPVGYVCSRNKQGETPTIYDILPNKYKALKTVGRLDKDSSGLIILTNDGDFAFQMTHPKFYKTKVYEIEINRPLAPLHQQMISDYGVEIGDGVSKLSLNKLNNIGTKFQVTMHEGRNRQIRRTFEALGYSVVGLDRKVFGKFQLSGLKPGEFTEFKI